MAATKTWNIGDVLTASDLNSNFSKLPLAMSAITATGPSTAIASGSSATIAIAFPASRFTVAPIVTLSTTGAMITPVVNAVTSGTVTVAMVNNGAASQGASTITVYGVAVQMTSGTAAG